MYQNSLLENTLKSKRDDLERYKTYYLSGIKNVNSGEYEQNAISVLLTMKDLKTEIRQLESLLFV